jgi:hypothetical protein
MLAAEGSAMNAYARGRPSVHAAPPPTGIGPSREFRNLSSEVPNESSEVPPDARGAGGD